MRLSPEGGPIPNSEAFAVEGAGSDPCTMGVDWARDLYSGFLFLGGGRSRAEANALHSWGGGVGRSVWLKQCNTGVGMPLMQDSFLLKLDFMHVLYDGHTFKSTHS